MRPFRAVPHWLALFIASMLVVAFALSVIVGNYGLGMLLICAGFAPTATFVLAKQKPGSAQLAVWELGAVVLVLFSAFMTYYAITERRLMSNGEACRLKVLVFENEWVETMRVEWWPPRVQCEYGYLGRTEVEWESKWGVYYPFALVPLTALVIAGAANRNWPRPSKSLVTQAA